jgi:hypothetical protein
VNVVIVKGRANLLDDFGDQLLLVQNRRKATAYFGAGDQGARTLGHPLLQAGLFASKGLLHPGAIKLALAHAAKGALQGKEGDKEGKGDEEEEQGHCDPLNGGSGIASQGHGAAKQCRGKGKQQKCAKESRAAPLLGVLELGWAEQLADVCSHLNLDSRAGARSGRPAPAGQSPVAPWRPDPARARQSGARYRR